jgi:diguanylate cyclase (GGDEF)-like protein/PAS domain S-box-containing protein
MSDKTDKSTKRKQVQEKLRTSEIRYRRLFETARDGILILDVATRRITEVNPFMVELLGYSRDEFLGKELWEIGLLKDVKANRDAFRELMRKGHIRYEDLPLQTEDGKQREVEFVSNVYEEDGHEVIQCNIRDITERKQVEENLNKAHNELKALVAVLQRRDSEMQLLYRMNDLLQTCVTQEEAYTVVALVAAELFAGQSGCLAILDASNRYLDVVVLWGDETQLKSTFSLEDCWALRRGHPHEVIDPQASLLCSHFVHQPETGYLCVPLIVQGETLGMFCLVGSAATRGTHQASRQQLAVTVGEAIKLCLSNLRLREELREQAIRDPLTGLFNRRYLEGTLPRELHRAQRGNSPLCLAMLDLDHFKRFNDIFGHDAGDSILRELGKVLRENLRKSDISCRYGGEEFVLILPDSSLADCLQRVEQIRVLVKGLEIRQGQQLLGTMTVSAGVAGAPEHGSNASELLRAADNALYAAKQAGRDCVVVYQATESQFEKGGT